MKLGMMLGTNEYYIFINKNQSQLEAIESNFEKWCKITEIRHFFQKLT